MRDLSADQDPTVATVVVTHAAFAFKALELAFGGIGEHGAQPGSILRVHISQRLEVHRPQTVAEQFLTGAERQVRPAIVS